MYYEPLFCSKVGYVMPVTEAQKKAIAKYEAEKVDRINCRLPKGTKERILATGMTVNSFIIDAVNEKLESITRK